MEEVQCNDHMKQQKKDLKMTCTVITGVLKRWRSYPNIGRAIECLQNVFLLSIMQHLPKMVNCDEPNSAPLWHSL
jgi:hypothetical protein